MGIGVIIGMIVVLAGVFAGMVVFLQKFFKSEVTTATTHLDTLMSETQAKEEQIQKQFEEAKRQSAEIVANAQKDGQQQRDAIIKQAEEDRHKMLTEAQAKIDEMIKQADNARLALLNEAEQKINERAVERAVEFLQAALPEEFRKEVHQRWVAGVIANSFEALDRLRIPQGITAVQATSAFALSDKERGALKAKLKEKLGFEVGLTEAVDPGVIAGLVVSIGSLVLDGSLKFAIQEKARAKSKQSGS